MSRQLYGRLVAVSSEGGTRTRNPPINSRMLCQLSYLGMRHILAWTGGWPRLPSGIASV